MRILAIACFVASLPGVAFAIGTPNREVVAQANSLYQNIQGNLAAGAGQGCHVAPVYAALKQALLLEGMTQTFYNNTTDRNRGEVYHRMDSDTLETLAPLSTRAILDVAKAYRRNGCPEMAEVIYRKVIETYTGLWYQAARQEAQIGLDDLRPINH